MIGSERELMELSRRFAARYQSVRAPARFRRQLHGSLLAAPVTLLPGRERSLVLRPVLAFTLVLALLAATGGGAAAASLPGDPAFPLKRGVEQVQVALSSDEVARLDTLVTQADSRLVDLETLTARRSNAVAAGVEEYVAASARALDQLTRVVALPASPRRDAALARASGASADHLARLESLAARLPDAAQHGIQRAIQVQQTVHGKSGNAPGRGGSLPVTPGAPEASTPVAPTHGGPPTRSPGRP